jgi:hypothetical protein
MKNQDFGDNRDLLKFDLVYQIVKKGLVDQFTYVPMLTEDVARKEEPEFCRHHSTGGGENAELVQFLDKCVINEKRNVGQLNGLFKQWNIKGAVYAQDTIFSHESRQAYFAGIPQDSLTRSLVLIDPDKGLEDDDNGSGNLLFADLRDIYQRMDAGSLLMFTQRFPYDLYKEYLGMRVEEIQQCLTGSQPISLDDMDSIIFFLTRDSELQQRLIQFLTDYTRQYVKKD